MSKQDPDYTFTIKCRETGPDGIDRITPTEVDGDRIVINDEAVKVLYNSEDGPHYYLPLRHFFGYDREDYVAEAATDADAEGEEVAA